MTAAMAERIERALEETLAQNCRPFDQRLVQAMSHSLLGGGKRLRAKLVLLFCEMLGGKEENAIPLACAMEMIHAHSLIHDDLPSMDNADTRRGRPSCHMAYDEATALLAGDALLTLAFQTVTAHSGLTDQQKTEAVCLLSGGTYGMLIGQAMDKAFENQDIDLATLERLQNNKTGALIGTACVLGCVAAKGDGKSREDALVYGTALGRAFQIVDDILDVTSTAEAMGKPVGNDEQCHKNTFVSLLGLEEARRQAGEFTNKAIAALSGHGERADKLIRIAHSMQERKN